MKPYLLLLVLSAYSSLALSQSTLSLKANMINGTGIQEDKLKTAYGIGAQFEAPFKKVNPLKFTVGFDFGINGMKKVPYELQFRNSVTNTNVHYTSYLMQLSSGVKYLLRDNKKWSPYAALSGGLLSYYTEMSIEDPHDRDGCSPLETKPVLFSMVLASKAETGVRIKTKKRCRGSVSYFEAGVGYVAGTRGRYLNLSNDHHNHDEESEYMIKFRHNTTAEEHNHSLGKVYRTAASQLALHAALVFRL